MIIASNKWDVRFLRLCEHVSAWSKDPSTKVGAVIADGRDVISFGYNGLPKGVDDTTERYDDREIKYELIVHAEVNAIITSKTSVEGCTLYTTPFPPCSRCAGIVIQSGIKRVVSWAESLDNPRWKDSFNNSQMMFRESHVTFDVISQKEAQELLLDKNIKILNETIMTSNSVKDES